MHINFSNQKYSSQFLLFNVYMYILFFMGTYFNYTNSYFTLRLVVRWYFNIFYLKLPIFLRKQEITIKKLKSIKQSVQLFNPSSTNQPFNLATQPDALISFSRGKAQTILRKEAEKANHSLPWLDSYCVVITPLPPSSFHRG